MRPARTARRGTSQKEQNWCTPTIDFVPATVPSSGRPARRSGCVAVLRESGCILHALVLLGLGEGQERIAPHWLILHKRPFACNAPPREVGEGMPRQVTGTVCATRSKRACFERSVHSDAPRLDANLQKLAEREGIKISGTVTTHRHRYRFSPTLLKQTIVQRILSAPAPEPADRSMGVSDEAKTRQTHCKQTRI